jgi:ribosome recycling factor
LAARATEEQRVAVRNIRRDANEQIKAQEKQGMLTEDDRSLALDQIQKITNGVISNMDELLAAKEKEIMEV